MRSSRASLLNSVQGPLRVQGGFGILITSSEGTIRLLPPNTETYFLPKSTLTLQTSILSMSPQIGRGAEENECCGGWCKEKLVKMISSPVLGGPQESSVREKGGKRQRTSPPGLGQENSNAPRKRGKSNWTFAEGGLGRVPAGQKQYFTQPPPSPLVSPQGVAQGVERGTSPDRCIPRPPLPFSGNTCPGS